MEATENHTSKDQMCNYDNLKRLTLPRLLSVASKHITIRTPDHCHCRPFVIAARVKVGSGPAISGSSVQQLAVEYGAQGECLSAIWSKCGVALMTGMCSLGRVVSAQLGFLQLGKTQLQLATPYELPCLQVQQAGLCEGNSKYTGSVCHRDQ